METRFLGRSGLEVSVLSFGVMTFGEGNTRFVTTGDTHAEAARRQIDMCIEAGVNLFDTADVYSFGQSEEELGRALGSRRKDVLVATKAFGRMGEAHHDTGLSRRHLIAACEDSLRRLGTDWIDLYQLHSPDMRVPIEETMRALDDLVTAGKIRYVGCSNWSGWQLMKSLGISDANGYERFVGQQIQYSLLVRDAEQELLPCGVSEGVGALIWSPLAQGFLTGKFRQDQSGTKTRLGDTGAVEFWNTERSNKVVDKVLELAGARGVSASQVALNWLLRRPGVTTVLVGARTDEQLTDNLAAAQWSLSDAELEALDRASQEPMAYPNSHHRRYAAERNPQLFPRYSSKK
ncbi:MAG: aldo/keto reductase [Sphingomonadaceae bacterium]|nr:aldo/keto reductase [Sphingomonadaceae bacterium]